MFAVKSLHPEIVIWCTRLCIGSSIQYVFPSQLRSFSIGRSSVGIVIVRYWKTQRWHIVAGILPKNVVADILDVVGRLIRWNRVDRPWRSKIKNRCANRIRSHDRTGTCPRTFPAMPADCCQSRFLPNRHQHTSSKYCTVTSFVTGTSSGF